MNGLFKTFVSGLLIFCVNGYAQSSTSTVELVQNGTAIKLVKDGSEKTCILERPAQAVSLSYDEKAVIVTAGRSSGYVQLDKLMNCSAPLGLTNIGAKGWVTDINLRYGIYISLQMVGVKPLVFLATVSKLDSTVPLVNLNGSLVKGVKLSRLRKYAFEYDDETKSRISLDGRYVSVDGKQDCTESPYTGVWDLKNKTRVVFTGSQDEIQSKCDELFKK